jgi:phosphoribosyl-AMP cyclohydrolase
LQKNNLQGQVSRGMCQTLMHIRSDCNANTDVLLLRQIASRKF